MLSGGLKIIATVATLWFGSPSFVRDSPESHHPHLHSGLDSWLVPRAVSLYLQTLVSVLLLTKIWTTGNRPTNAILDSVQQICRRLLLYTGLPAVLVALGVTDFKWGNYSMKTKMQCAAGAVLCFTMTSNKRNVYGLEHGRLHLDTQTPMWMNMGYWEKHNRGLSRPVSLAEACRDLLNLVLAEAGLSGKTRISHSRCLLDVGFGCGEQTIHLMSERPIRPSDKLWWEEKHLKVRFDEYVGITQNEAQFQYAQTRVEEMKKVNVRLFCADASKPRLWDEQLLTAIDTAASKSRECWLLALDTAYHFSPSRWVLVDYVHKRFGASFMAFDLCLSPQASNLQKLSLRILTTLMGAPWTNFVTPEIYRQKLLAIGYSHDNIKITDISECVFGPLAQYMEEQHARLGKFGLGLGSFQAAKRLFGWWASTGVIRGVVVVAKYHDDPRKVNAER